MLFASCLVLGYRWRVRSLHQRHQELETVVATRTAEVEQKRRELETSNVQLSEKGAALERENQERRRAEEETRRFAQELAHSNTELTAKQQQLERENQERRRAEEEAGRERDLLHALMDNTPDLIYFKNAECCYTRINEACAQVLGLARPDDVIGRSDSDFHAQDFARNARADERELLTSGKPLLGKVEHDTRNGRWYLATKVPLKNKEGKAIGLVGISKDITERKQAEDKLQHDLGAFLAVVNTVAQGDLTRRGQAGEDTLGRIARAVNQMLDSFSEILTGVRDTALSVSSSASEILAAATQIAKGAQHGSDQVETTTSAVEEMAASMKEVSGNAGRSAELARQVLDHLRAGEDAVNATAQGMTRIDSSVSQTAEKMRLLENRSKQIFEIITLIEEIASQSNLLSLNAAIEAAHAGDAGRGFSVVAVEIGRLAERSTKSTKEATAIVSGIVEETRLVLSAMENGIREVQAGRELSERAQQNLMAIQALVERSSAFSEQISNASIEQAQATQTVSQAMRTIATVTHESSAAASEAAKAVRDLVNLTDQVTQAVARFRVSERPPNT